MICLGSVKLKVSEPDKLKIRAESGAEVTLSASDAARVPEGNYENLTNLPQLDGRLIIGDIPEQDPTVPNWAKEPDPPEYTAEDIGAIPADAILGESELEIMWDSTEL